MTSTIASHSHYIHKTEFMNAANSGDLETVKKIAEEIPLDKLRKAFVYAATTRKGSIVSALCDTQAQRISKHYIKQALDTVKSYQELFERQIGPIHRTSKKDSYVNQYDKTTVSQYNEIAEFLENTLKKM